MKQKELYGNRGNSVLCSEFTAKPQGARRKRREYLDQLNKEDLNMGLIVRLIRKLVKGMRVILEKYIWIKPCFVMLISLMQISWSNMSDGGEAIANFTKKFNQEISKDYGFSLFGSGASFPVKIERITLSFQSKNCGDIISARKLAVEITHKMIDRMNQDKNLLKYLTVIPASARHVNLTIIFKDPNNAKTPGSLNSVMVIGPRDNLVFTTYNDAMTRLVELHEESFEEAERIVREEASSNSTNSNE